MSCRILHRWEYGEKFTVRQAYDKGTDEHFEAVKMAKMAIRNDWVDTDRWLNSMLATRICRKCGKKMVGRVGMGLYCFGLKDYAHSWTEVEPDKREKRDIRLKQLGIR